jgi:hypothetical protein
MYLKVRRIPLVVDRYNGERMLVKGEPLSP